EEGGDDLEIDAAVKDALKQHFLPEFLNRIDETIIFHPLTRQDLTRIVDLQLTKLVKQLEVQKITLLISDGAKAAIASEGYDPAYGARPLKRVIQQRLQNQLASELLKGNID